MCQMAHDLQVILPRAVREALLLHTNLDVEEGRAVARLGEEVDDDGAIDPP